MFAVVFLAAASTCVALQPVPTGTTPQPRRNAQSIGLEPMRNVAMVADDSPMDVYTRNILASLALSTVMLGTAATMAPTKVTPSGFALQAKAARIDQRQEKVTALLRERGQAPATTSAQVPSLPTFEAPSLPSIQLSVGSPSVDDLGFVDVVKGVAIGTLPFATIGTFLANKVLSAFSRQSRLEKMMRRK
mmetsp:Transcript_6758/g.17668  ORF Transcript_6758/g.17668 Transcript_6758/m.17668 type:complete len:190 (-) Transcript_6758:140-709(-)